MNLLRDIKKKIKQYLNQDQVLNLYRFLFRNSLINFFVGLLYGRNLTKLGIIYSSDKSGAHSYTIHYQNHFRKFKYKRISLLEIGVGGYESPYRGGNSLRMWKRYFPFGKIYSMDIYDKSPQEERRIKIYKGSQVDYVFLNNVVLEIGEIDLIIDDGSHINEHVINSFEYLFPKLKSGGIYVIEDTQTSYWEKYGGDSNNLNNSNTMMNFFKNFTDYLNYKEFNLEDYKPNYYEAYVKSIHFYHNLIFVYKK